MYTQFTGFIALRTLDTLPAYSMLKLKQFIKTHSMIDEYEYFNTWVSFMSMKYL